MRSENKDSGCWNPMGIPLGNIGTKNGRGKCAAKWRNVHILVKPHMYNLRCYSLCMRQLTIASRSVPKAGEHEVLGRHIWAQFAGVAIHTRRIRREVGDAEILQRVRIGGMDHFMCKQAWESQEQHPSTSVEPDMTLHSWIGVVQRLDRRRSRYEYWVRSSTHWLGGRAMLSAEAINAVQAGTVNIARWTEWMLQHVYIAGLESLKSLVSCKHGQVSELPSEHDELSRESFWVSSEHLIKGKNS